MLTSAWLTLIFGDAISARATSLMPQPKKPAPHMSAVLLSFCREQHTTTTRRIGCMIGESG